MKKKPGYEEIAALLDAQHFKGALQLLHKELAEDPNNHWLLTHLGLTYYEMGNYKAALAADEQALKVMPECPLVLWNYAGTLEALKRPMEACKVYRRIMGLESSPDRVDECWENDEWAEALVNDCVYRIGFCFAAEGDKELGLGLIRLYLDARLDGSSGTYSPEEVAECLSRFGTPPRRGTGAGSLLKAFQKLTADVPVSASTAAFPS